MADEYPTRTRKVAVKPDALAESKRQKRLRRAADRAANPGPPVTPTGPGGSWVILALDISSTNVGLTLLHDRQAVSAEHWRYRSHDPLVRLNAGATQFAMFLGRLPLLGLVPDVLAIEAPAQRAAGGGVMNIITQARMVGAFLYVWRDRFAGRPVIEVGPLQAKKALTGSGAVKVATKERMIACASEQCRHIRWVEHTADAFGIGLWTVGELERRRDFAREKGGA